VLAAAACPVCFPKLALLGSLVGLGAFSAYEAQLFIAAQVLVLAALAGHAAAYRQHRRAWLFGLALGSAAAVFSGLYIVAWEWLSYAGFGGLVVASGIDLRLRLPSGPSRASVITCQTAASAHAKRCRPTRASSSTSAGAAAACCGHCRAIAASFALMAR
jgi:mercuric ion transport protein